MISLILAVLFGGIGAAFGLWSLGRLIYLCGKDVGWQCGFREGCDVYRAEQKHRQEDIIREWHVGPLDGFN